MNIRYQGTSFAHLGKKLLSCSSLLFCFGLLSSFASAQLPELESPSTATGASTTAKFFGGATADNSDTFGSSFRGDQPLDIFVEIQVESDHINTVGNVYLLIQLGADIFMRLQSGEYVIWDQTLNSLQATLQGRTLQASEPITILENVAFGSAGLSGASLAIFVAYDTMAASGELYYSGMNSRLKRANLLQRFLKLLLSLPLKLLLSLPLSLPLKLLAALKLPLKLSLPLKLLLSLPLKLLLSLPLKLLLSLPLPLKLRPILQARLSIYRISLGL